MHEWALADSVITAAFDFAKKKKMKKLEEIKIGIGELQQIDKEILRFALNEILKEKRKKIKFVFEIEKSKMKCNNCESIWSFDDIKKGLNEDEVESIHFVPEVALAHLRCPKCKSPDFEIVKGRGISIISIKGE